MVNSVKNKLYLILPFTWVVSVIGTVISYFIDCKIAFGICGLILLISVTIGFISMFNKCIEDN
jgi:hypothetical protein